MKVRLLSIEPTPEKEFMKESPMLLREITLRHRCTFAAHGEDRARHGSKRCRRAGSEGLEEGRWIFPAGGKRPRGSSSISGKNHIKEMV
jgi:hypothetical protein